MGMDAYLVSLKLLDAERGVVETWISEQITKAQAAPAALRVPVQKWFGTLIGQTLPGTLRVTGGVIGAAVSIDGAQVGLLGADGLTIAGVAAGPHQLTVSKTGYEKLERSVTLGSGALEKVAIEMKSTEAPAAEPATAPAAQPAAEPAATESESVPAAPEIPNQGARVGAWALLGLGIVGVGLGGYFSYEVTAVNSTLDRYRRYPCPGSGALTCNANGTQNPIILTQADINYSQNQKDKGNTYATLQWVGYGVGAALLVTSGVLFYRGYTSTAGSETANTHAQHSNLVLIPTVAPNSVGALAYLRF
jgi:hypothetical protein